MSLWSGEFRDPEEERAFLAEQWPRTARQLRLVSAIAALGYLSALYLNYLSFGLSTPYYVMGGVRIAVAGLLLALFRSTRHGDRYTAASRALLVCAELSLGVGEVVEYHYYQAQSGGVSMESGIPFILFAILVFYTAFSNRLLLTAATALAAGSFTLFYLWLGPYASPAAVANYLPTLLVVNGLGIAVVRGWNRLSRRDFIQRRQLRHEIEERRRAQEEAERANRAKSRFLATMNHELRTPLNGMLGGVQLLQETPLSPAQQGHAEIIDRAGRQLAALIDDVLDLARIEAGRVDLAREDFDLADLLADVEAMLRLQAAGRGLALTVTSAEGTPRWLRGDPVRLRQVLLNLGGNALKFTERGAVAIAVTPLARSADAVRLRFAVSDTGIGLTEEEQRSIFRPFAQADDSIRRRYGGSGLGLAICRELVTAMGGAIELESAKGRGSSFFFELELPTGRETTAAPELPAPAVPFSLLLVEDFEPNRVIACALLEWMGHSVAQADSGAEGLRLAAAHDFDAILMDLHMPEMDGFETARRIRALAERKRAAVPIIALSADARQSAVEACYAAGMQAFVSKPLVRDTLMRALAEAVASRGDSVRAASPSRGETAVAPVVNDSHLAEIRADLGEERYALIIETCREALRRLLAETGQALAARDWLRLARETHRLKGLAGSYGLRALHRQACDLEAVAGCGEDARTAQLHGEMAALVDAAIAELAEQ
ncbi:MAG: ATP-binding protein [Gammaproteobacteria bacterium]|nr:ATP-binding protein [Gammaproteobacteria bacterium]